jgi:hypothetical protein
VASWRAGRAAAAARAALRRNGGLFSPVITRAGPVIVASRPAGSDRSPMTAAS